MSNVGQKEFERKWSDLVNSIRTQATPFARDSTEKKIARVKRAREDKFYFASMYFPHYVQLDESYLRPELKQPKGPIYIPPDAEIDWVKAGFSADHATFFRIAELNNRLEILAAYRESAKDTLLGKIDVLHKIFCETAWFVPIVAFSIEHAETKVIPLKLEIENNDRLKNDFGELKGVVQWESGAFITSNNRKVQAFGRDQSLRGQENMGHRPDWIVLNDVEDPTKTTNQSLILKYVESIKQDILKSANSPRWGAILLCNYVSKQSIVHELLTGQNTDHYGKHIFRALVPNDKKTDDEREIAHECRLNRYSDVNRSAWEFRHPTVRLLAEQKADPDTFDPEMMMRPGDRKNKKFKDADFRYYTRSQIDGRQMTTYCFVDPSVKDASDYKAILSVGIPIEGDEFEAFVLDAWIRQAPIDAMLEETYEQWERHKLKIIGLETIAFAALLEREYLRLMKRKGKPLPIQRIDKVDNKEARIERLVPIVRTIIRFNPEQGDQALLIRQLKAFPDRTPVSRGGIGDDGPDALEQVMKLVQDYPYGAELQYRTIRKREAVFAQGAY